MLDLTKLSLKELFELNRAVVNRIRFLQEKKREQALLSFSIGDRVWFQCDHGHRNEGTVIKINRKTVSVFTDDRKQWNISPNYLRKFEENQESRTNHPPDNLLVLPGATSVFGTRER